MKKTTLFSLIGFLVGTESVLLLFNMIWVGFIDSPAKLELDKPYFLISNGFLVSILLVIALMLVKLGGRSRKAKLEAANPELGLLEFAYLIWRRMPIRERALSEIKNKYPEMSDVKILEAISKAEALNLGASMQAEGFRLKATTKENGIRQLENNHPGFPKKLYATAWGYGMQDTR